MQFIKCVTGCLKQHAAHIEFLSECISWYRYHLCDDFPLMPNLKEFHGNLHGPMNLIAPRLEKLVVLDNSWNYMFLRSALSSCQFLRYIHFQCKLINNVLDVILAANPYLETIIIDQCQYMGDNESMHVLESISTHCRNMKRIAFDARYEFKLESRLPFALECEALRVLTLLEQNCPRLRTIFMFPNYLNSALEKLIEHCHKFILASSHTCVGPVESDMRW